MECTQGSVIIIVLDKPDNSLYCSPSASDRTQSRILGLCLSTRVAFQSILLVLEEDPNKKRPAPIVVGGGAGSLDNLQCRNEFLLA